MTSRDVTYRYDEFKEIIIEVEMLGYNGLYMFRGVRGVLNKIS